MRGRQEKQDTNTFTLKNMFTLFGAGAALYAMGGIGLVPGVLFGRVVGNVAEEMVEECRREASPGHNKKQ